MLTNINELLQTVINAGMKGTACAENKSDQSKTKNEFSETRWEEMCHVSDILGKTPKNDVPDLNCEMCR